MHLDHEGCMLSRLECSTDENLALTQSDNHLEGTGISSHSCHLARYFSKVPSPSFPRAFCA